MRLSGLMRAGLIALLTVTVAAVLMNGRAAPPPRIPHEAPQLPLTVYHADPGHLWNRLHDALFVRIGKGGEEYGRDRVEPLLWRTTKHLLGGESHRRLLAVLDEFNRGGESLFTDPLRRAMLQRDLWLVFSWLESSHDDFYAFGETPGDWRRRQHALREPLARAIRALALTAEQVAALPDTYAAAAASPEFGHRFDPEQPERHYLPADLFVPDGPWVSLGRGNDLIAGAHVLADNPFTTSAFLVFIKLPAGRTATRDYVERLAAYDRRHLATELPQFPSGTEVALVRLALLVTSTNQLMATRLVETVQVRVYRHVPSPTPDLVARELVTDETRAWQSFFEFVLSRARLFEGRAGGLWYPNSAPEFLTGFSTHGIDPFETVHGETPQQAAARTPESLAAAAEPQRHQSRRVEMCIACHPGPGVHSFNTYVQNQGRLSAARVEDVLAAGLRWKRNTSDWRLLRELMVAANAR